MFSGIVQAVGRIARIESAGTDRRFKFDAGDLGLDDVRPGASLCVNGVCLTVIASTAREFDADISAETLSCTTLGRLAPGSPVNLEKSLAAGGRLDGHFVTGHVDGTGRITTIGPEGRSKRVDIETPDALARYWARKGSVCVDGTSLTINDAAGSRFSVNIIPATLERTIFATYRSGTEVNLEVDILARYIEQLLRAKPA
ncbi:MAG: riboflavin synthase [Gammaproteobacteria bacterium]|nr:riboflavin synthase [Gammaproteobacteria bacterium]